MSKVDMSQAKAWYEKSITVLEKMNNDEFTAEDKERFLELYETLVKYYARVYDLYDSSSPRANNSVKAKRWHERSIKMGERLSFELGMKEADESLSQSYYRLGEICRISEKNLTEAKKWHMNGLKIREQLVGEKEKNSSSLEIYLENVFKSSEELAYICASEREWSEEKKYREECLKIAEQLYIETGEDYYREKIVFCNEALGNACKKVNDLIEARKRFAKCIRIEEERCGIYKADGPYYSPSLAWSYFDFATVDESALDLDLLKMAESIFARLGEEDYAVSLQKVREAIALAESQQPQS